MKKLAVIGAFVAVLAFVFFVAQAAEKGKPQAKNPVPGQAGQILPKKASVDTNFDGKPDRTEHYDSEGRVTTVEIDANGDGLVEETVTYQDGRPVRSARDTNNDGKPDVWMDF